ncbi:MAG: SPOR domain-containing protein, partial [Ramlibacter sp.]|nr:SPOR domain-containing protein [Ramlibacter sp.]
SAPAAGASAPAAAASASVPLGATLLPTLTPGTGTYALQAGQFASQQSAEQLSAGINGQGVTSSVIPTTDERGTSWAVVTVGRFSSPEMALSQRSYLSNKLGLPQYLMPIAVPPPKPSP